jgi:hypothetical protein
MVRTSLALSLGLLASWCCVGTAAGQVGGEADAIDHAAGRDRQPLTVRLFWENDAGRFQGMRDTDRYYTNGAGLAVAWHPDWADDLAGYLPFAEAFGELDRTGFGVTTGQLIFTPEDITVAELIPDDRPYAGYLYGGVYLQRMTDTVLEHYQLDLGLIGDSSLAQDAQEWVHQLLADPDPNGWDNQLADEVTVQFTYRRKWRFDLFRVEPFDTPIDVQVIPEVAGFLGTVHRRVEGGGTVRFGYQLPDDFGAARLADVNTTPGTLKEGLSAYGFVRGAARLIEHNVFLEGSNFDGSHSVPIRTVVGEFQFGVVASYTADPMQVELGWSRTLRSEAFEGQAGGHSFGAFTLGLHYWF